MTKVMRFENIEDLRFQEIKSEYSVLSVVANEEYSIFTGKNEVGLFNIKLNKDKLLHWRYSLCDFILYTVSLGKVPILIVTENEYNEAINFYEYCKNTQFNLREYEPKVLIHSTLEENWVNIKNDGYLFSWNYLQSKNKTIESKPIGHQLGDPIDYSDFIMLGYGDSLGGEYVVMSKKAGRIKCCDNDIYEPGVRLYFNAVKMAEDGILVRDGIHLKVRDQIALESYLLDTIIPTMIESEIVFTPKTFSKLANQLFEKRRKE